MVKSNKKRVMVSLTKPVLKGLDELCEAYGYNKSQMITHLVLFHKERMKG